MQAATSGKKAVNLSNFTTVLLEHIFSYLTLSDMKIVRLVCKHWHEISYGSPFIHNQVTVLRNYEDLAFPFMFSTPHKYVKAFLSYEGNPPSSANQHTDRFWIHHGQSIEKLDITVAEQNFEVFLDCLEYCPSLEHLSLTTAPKFMFKPLRNIFDKIATFQKLKTLNLKGDPQVILLFLLEALKKSPVLEKFCFDCASNDCDFDHEEIVFNYREVELPDVKEIEITCSNLKYDFIDKVAEVFCFQIESFAIRGSCWLPIQSLNGLFMCLNLKQLFLQKWLFRTNHFTDKLINLQQLTTLSFYGSSELIGLACLKNLPNLSHLDLSYCQMDNYSELHEAVNPNLIELRIAGSENLKNREILEIAPKLVNLRILNLSDCKRMTLGSVWAITNYARKLECFSLKNCMQIENLDMNESGDIALRINRLQEIVHLDVRNIFYLTDECIKCLNLPKLEALDWTNSKKGTFIAIEQLKLHCPSLKYCNRFSFPCGITDEERFAVTRKKYIHKLKCSNSPFGTCYVPKVHFQNTFN